FSTFAKRAFEALGLVGGRGLEFVRFVGSAHFWMHRGHMHRSHQPSARWLALGTLPLGLLIPAGGARGDLPAASAALSPHVQVLGDSLGTAFTFTVTNPAGGQSVGMVDIDTPSRLWTARSCPQAPAGWTAGTDEDGCSYRNTGD